MENTGVDLPLEVSKPDGELVRVCPYRLLCARSGPATGHRTDAHNSMCGAIQTTLAMAGIETWVEAEGMWATELRVRPDHNLPDSMCNQLVEVIPDLVYRNGDGHVIVADCKTQWGQTNHTIDVRPGTSSLLRTATNTRTSYNSRIQANRTVMLRALRLALGATGHSVDQSQSTPPGLHIAAEESPLSEQIIIMDFTMAPMVMGVFGEVNAPVLQVLEDAADAGLEQFFPTVVTTSQKVARAQLSALMARRLGVAMTAARADAYLRALAERGDPHRPHFRHMAPLARPRVQHALKPHRDRCRRNAHMRHGTLACPSKWQLPLREHVTSPTDVVAAPIIP